MDKYLFKARCTAEGTKGLANDGGSGRREAIGKLIDSVGGRLECFYAFGDVDVYAIANLPDKAAAAAAFTLVMDRAGGAEIETMVLLSPEKVDKAGR